MGVGHRVMSGLGFEVVACFLERQSRLLVDRFDCPWGKFRMGVESRANGGTAECQFGDIRFDALNSIESVLDL